MRAHTVLIVDDEPSIVDLWTRLLQEVGYDVVSAADAKEGLRALDGRQVTVAICDVHLPGASGLWLAEMIRQEHPATAIVITSGDPLIPPWETLRPAVVAYVVKPVSREELLTTVKTGVAWSQDRTRVLP